MQSPTLNNQIIPIGYFYSEENERYSLPKQPGSGKENHGKIVLNPHQNFEQALDDLIGFSHIWVLFLFHKNQDWKPKVLTPRGGPKRGLFATRSPHRPNPIGMSCLELVDVQGRELFVINHDLLNNSPILDIKPYIEYSDSKTHTKQGWLETTGERELFHIVWSNIASKQFDYLESDWNLNIRPEIHFRLRSSPLPGKNNRIQHLSENFYQLAYKTWRIIYSINANEIEILKIYSGYDKETLSGLKTSRWNDVPIHQVFSQKYP